MPFEEVSESWIDSCCEALEAEPFPCAVGEEKSEEQSKSHVEDTLASICRLGLGFTLSETRSLQYFF